MKNVLLLGATGNLGAMIGHELLARGAKLRVLVRPGSRAKLDPAIASRAEIVEDEATAFQNIDTVVSSVQGGPETIVTAQLKWLAAARQAGVRRFIPSSFSFDFFGLADGENINSDWRRQFAKQAEAIAGPVEIVHIMIGCFLDHGVLFGFLGAIDLNKREAYLWGDGNAKMEFTTYADTAAVTAEAALSDAALPSRLKFAAESLTFHELVKEVEIATGAALTVRRLGSLGDLDAAIAKAQTEQPGNMFAWLPNMYWRGMLSGKGGLGELHNSKFPSLRPTRVRDYLEANPLPAASSAR
jgi:nucleoside-diphosphate-sugar epimerase